MKRVLLVLLLSVVVPLTISAKPLSNREKRRIYADVINAVEVYELSATVRDDGSKYNFLNLFKSPKARIYCDLMDYHSEDGKIEVLEYIDLLSKKNLVEVDIKSLSRGKLQQRNDGWHMTVSFFKKLNYMDENDVWFSSEEYYNNDYHITMDFVYDEDAQRCYVASIDGNIESDRKHLPQQFMVIQYSSENDNKLKIGDFMSNTVSEKASLKRTTPLQFNEFKQAYARPIDIMPWNDNIHIKYDTLATTKSYNYIKLKYNKTPWRAKLRFAYALTGAYDIYGKSKRLFWESTTPYDKNIRSKSKAYEYGLDLGITFSMGHSTQMGFYMGAAMQNSEISISQEKDMIYNYTTYTYKKPNNNNGFNENDTRPNTITHKYNITSAKEQINYTDLVVPVYFGFDHRLANVLSLTWSVGAKMYINMKTAYSYHLAGNRTTDNQKITIDGVYDSFLFNSDYNYAPHQLFNGYSGYSVSALATFGFNFNLYKRRIYFSTKVGFEYGITEIHSSEGNVLFDGTSNYPLVYSGNSEKDVATRSFMDCVSFRHRAIWLDAGLIFKF